MIFRKTTIGKGTLIEPTAIIQDGCDIGAHCFIGHYCVLRPGTVIGNKTVIGHLTVFEGDCKVGDNCLIHAQCHITKGAVIEDKVFIAPGFVGCNDKKMVHLRRNGPFIPCAYTIKKGARIAAGVLVMPGVTIGREAVVGLGSVVTKDVGDYEIVYGNPARVKGIVPEDQRL